MAADDDAPVFMMRSSRSETTVVQRSRTCTSTSTSTERWFANRTVLILQYEYYTYCTRTVLYIFGIRRRTVPVPYCTDLETYIEGK